jgi:predicted unusual protein kinase regulating ubiquinone biosynthesis (AarF/ABC1/UbiB family)
MLRARYRRIVFYFGRVILNLLWWDVFLARLGLRRLGRRNRHRRMQRIAESYRSLAIEMGGVLIKAGQFLSARVDVLPKEVTDELAGLQDEVPPEDFEAIRQLAESELGERLEQRFAHFDQQPLAAASLGQVHRASLRITPTPDSETPDNAQVNVVVKVQRPNIEAIIRTDLAALNTVGKWLKRYKPIRKRADVPALMDEFSRILFEEIDYLAEGRNAETFQANFDGRQDVRVPRVFWQHTTQKVLTLEDVYGIKITDYAEITEAGIDRKQVAKRLFDTYLEQIFKHEFFHADPHPGNLFVENLPDADDADAWRLTFVDFGMVGRIPANTRAGLREAVIGIGTQDSQRVVQAYRLLGMLLPGADLGLLEKAEEAMFERFWGKSMSELADIDFDEMHEFAKEFRELIYDMPFQVPQDLMFLGRCVAILSGMCTGLDPEFNVWEAIMPFARDLLAEEVGGGWDFWRDEALDLVKTTAFLPRRLDRTLDLVERGKLEVRLPELSTHLKRLEAVMRRLNGALIFAALLMGGVQLYVADKLILGGILLGGAFLALLWAFVAGIRRRR